MSALKARELLQQLVAVDSTSPRPNGPVLDLLESELGRVGFVSRRQRWLDSNGVEKQNLIARRGPDRPGGLALVGHSDCVPFDPTWEGALSGHVEGNKLFGRGSADTKGFLAAAVCAAARTEVSGLPLHIVATADEEVGCLGAKKLLEEGVLRPAHAIIGEPTRLIPVRAHKGYCLAEITVSGIEAHSAYPELGASAIAGAGQLLRDIERIQAQVAVRQDALFTPPYTTLNVGLIQGGKAKNVVPGWCTLTLEWRPIPGVDVRDVLGRVEAACARLTSESGGRVTAAVRAMRLDGGVAVAPDAAIVRFLEAASGRPSGTIPFGSELPQLTALGAEACVFGPGDIRDAHKTGEFVPLDELATAEEVLTKAIVQFC
jgi:acetylornithine deacetylase